LYVSHLGWLHAIPEGGKKSRLATFKAVDEEHPSLKLPDIEEHSAGYIIGLLYEAGLMSTSGMGPVPLSWVEIEHWLRCTDRELSLWEKLMVKQLSDEYVNELSLATDRLRPAPYSHVVVDEIDRDAVASKIMAIFGGLKKAPPSEEQKDTL